MFLPACPQPKVRALLTSHGLLTQEEPVAILGVRGYFSNSIGNPGNDIGCYDDAMFLCGPNGVFVPANANTDPSRIGWNPGVGKPFALLQPGVWYFFRGAHKGKVPALRQATDEDARVHGIPNDGEFQVERVWGPRDPRNYKETGYFAINIHSGGENSTSSWGCQTIPPDQFRTFMDKVWEEMIRIKQSRIAYCLVEGPIN